MRQENRPLVVLFWFLKMMDRLEFNSSRSWITHLEKLVLLLLVLALLAPSRLTPLTSRRPRGPTGGVLAHLVARVSTASSVVVAAEYSH